MEVELSKEGLPLDGARISQAFPKRVFEAQDAGKTFKDLELAPSAVLLVVPVHPIPLKPRIDPRCKTIPEAKRRGRGRAGERGAGGDGAQHPQPPPRPPLHPPPLHPRLLPTPAGRPGPVGERGAQSVSGMGRG